jgi:hypothetical protein
VRYCHLEAGWESWGCGVVELRIDDGRDGAEGRGDGFFVGVDRYTAGEGIQGQT